MMPEPGRTSGGSRGSRVEAYAQKAFSKYRSAPRRAARSQKTQLISVMAAFSRLFRGVESNPRWASVRECRSSAAGRLAAQYTRCVRVAFLGGTYYVGPVAIPLLLAAGHDVVVAHSGAHEHPAVADAEHLHRARGSVLAEGGLVERWGPEGP